jgi:hypothetical protein
MAQFLALLFAFIFAVLATVGIPAPPYVNMGWLALALLILAFLLGMPIPGFR